MMGGGSGMVCAPSWPGSLAGGRSANAFSGMTTLAVIRALSTAFVLTASLGRGAGLVGLRANIPGSHRFVLIWDK